MRILIVDDCEELAQITADLLRCVDESAHGIEAVSLAGDLETAIRLLPHHDAVLCDGEFPISQHSTFIREEWDLVHREALRRGVHFVLYSGCAHALCEARNSHIPALPKPAAIKEIYAVLTERRLAEGAVLATNQSAH